MDCRQLEVRQAKAELEKRRLVWLIAEHEMGGDDFLSVLRKSQEADKYEFFRLDLGSFEGLTDDLNALQAITMGGDIAQLCNQLLYVEKSYLLLDNIRLGGNEENQRIIFSGIKEIAQTVLDYCPNVLIVARSSLPFEIAGVRPVYLRALDEPECKIYVELHPHGINVKEESIKTGAVHSHTGGWPGRIDKLLKALAVSSFDNLVHGSSDQSIDQGATLPDALVEAIESLRSGDDYQKRVYDLLVILTIFKFGESYTTIRRFGGGLKLRPTMVDDLIGLGLAEPAETYELGVKAGEQEKFIIIKPVVQQYIYKFLGEEALVKYYEDAAAIYFGKNWRVGEYRLHSAFRFSDQRIYSIIEQNAVLILARMISDALDSSELESRDKNVLDRVRVLHYYLLKLANSSKYLYVVRLSSALLPILSDYNDHNLVKDIRYQYVRGLRMLNEYEDSIQQSELLLAQTNPAVIVASLYINMAYSYECLEDVSLAEKMAKKVLDMKVKSDSEYHARGILLGLSSGSGKYQKLQRLAAKARQNNHFVSSNNLKLDLISELNDPLQQLDEYKKLADSARLDGDSYNAMKAAVCWMEIAVEYGRAIAKKDFEVLLYAYKYACGQRQRFMFKKSHAVLWELLEKDRQVEALLQLYRHSSTLQRLTNKSEVELEYLRRLAGLVQNVGLEQVARSSDPSTLRYFAARANSHNLLSPKQLGLMQ